MSNSIFPLSIIIHFSSVRFLPKTIRLGNIFGTRPDLVKTLECPWYYLSILIWSNYFGLEVSLASRFKILLGLAFNVAFVCVFSLFWYLTFSFFSIDLVFQFSIYVYRTLIIKQRRSHQLLQIMNVVTLCLLQRAGIGVQNYT